MKGGVRRGVGEVEEGVTIGAVVGEGEVEGGVRVGVGELEGGVTRGEGEKRGGGGGSGGATRGAVVGEGEGKGSVQGLKFREHIATISTQHYTQSKIKDSDVLYFKTRDRTSRDTTRVMSCGYYKLPV